MSCYNTSYPENCEYIYSIEVLDTDLLMIEKQIHLNLDKYRINKKEFFNVDLNYAIETIKNVCNNIQKDIDKMKEHEKKKEKEIHEELSDVELLDKKSYEYIISKIKIENKKTDFEMNIKKIFTCEFCSKTLNFKSNLTKHKKVCKSKTDSICVMERELGIIVKPPEIYSCRFCNIKFSQQSCFSRHMNKGCKEKNQYKQTLVDKLNAKNDPIRDQAYYQKKYYERNPECEKMDKLTRFKCNFCRKGWCKQSYLDRHTKKGCNESEMYRICKIENQLILYDEQFQKQKRLFDVNCCHFCERYFKNDISLGLHIQKRYCEKRSNYLKHLESLLTDSIVY